MRAKSYIGNKFISIMIVILIGYYGCKPKSVLDTVNPEIGIFGTDWVDAPSPEELAPGITYHRLESPQVKEILIKSKLDPRLIAKLKVIPFVIQLRKALEEKDYNFIEKHLGWRFTDEAQKEMGIDKDETMTSDEQFEKAKKYIQAKLRSKESFCDFRYLFEKKFPNLGLSVSEVDLRELKEKDTFHSYRLTYFITFPRGIVNEDGSEGLHLLYVELSVYGNGDNETFFGIEDFKNHQGLRHIRSQRPPEELFENW